MDFVELASVSLVATFNSLLALLMDVSVEGFVSLVAVFNSLFTSPMDVVELP